MRVRYLKGILSVIPMLFFGTLCAVAQARAETINLVWSRTVVEQAELTQKGEPAEAGTVVK